MCDFGGKMTWLTRHADLLSCSYLQVGKARAEEEQVEEDGWLAAMAKSSVVHSSSGNWNCSTVTFIHCI